MTMTQTRCPNRLELEETNYGFSVGHNTPSDQKVV